MPQDQRTDPRVALGPSVSNPRVQLTVSHDRAAPPNRPRIASAMTGVKALTRLLHSVPALRVTPALAATQAACNGAKQSFAPLVAPNGGPACPRPIDSWPIRPQNSLVPTPCLPPTRRGGFLQPEWVASISRNQWPSSPECAVEARS